MESTDFENPLEELNSLRQQVDIAETTEQMREIHQRISQVIDENPRLPLPKIAEALGVKVEKERKGVKLQIYATLKNIRPDIFDIESLPEGIQATEDKFGEQGVYFKKLDIVITPPNKDSRKITQGSGNGVEDKRIYNRVDLAIEVLTSMGINLFECPPFSYGTITDNMMRKTTYVHIKIPQLNKMIHICDEEGNRTFVIYTCENEEEYIEMRKEELKEDPLVKNFNWTDNVDEWKMRLLALLQNPIQPDNNNNGNSDGSEDKEEPVPNKPLEIKKMDREYFENPGNARADLEAFTQQLGDDKVPQNINSKNIRKLKITCSNGEKVNGRQYLERAGIALKSYKDHKEAGAKKAKALTALLKIGGFKMMDKEYFTSFENVNADLKAFAQQLEGSKKPQHLNPHGIQNSEITCANGEKIDGRKYLRRASIALGLSKNSKESDSIKQETVTTLLRIGKIEIKKMDREYFTDPTNVRTDLKAYIRQLGEHKKPIDLNTSTIIKLEIVCVNEEKIKGQRYLHRAGIALELAKTQHEAGSKRAIILKTLKQIAGY